MKTRPIVRLGRVSGLQVRLTRLVVLLFLALASPAAAQELLVNGSFEAGLPPWSGAGAVSTEQAHHGTHALHFTPGQGQAEQVVTVTPGEPYKLSAWIYLEPGFTGSDWGGVVLSATHYDWSGNYQSEFFTPANRPVGTWFQEVFSFNPTAATLRIRIGFFGGSGWSPRFFLDEISLRPLAGGNEPPRIDAITVNATAGTAPFLFTVEIAASDPDGAVTLIRHEMGDGAIRTGAAVAHTYGLGGDWLYRVTVSDDQGASASDSLWIEVGDPGDHVITITSPSGPDEWTTADPSIVLLGTRTGGSGAMLWRNERTEQGSDLPAGSTFTTPAIRLAPGRNPILVQSRAGDGTFRTDRIVVHRDTPGAGGPVFADLQASAAEVGTHTPWECTFDLETVATNPSVPYDPDPPPLLAGGTGVSVDAIFTRGSTTLTQPAWPAARFERAGDRLRPIGELRWTVRMSFVDPGVYTCRLRARDARGLTEIDGPTVDVAASDHPGFLRASASDNRYFEYDDGSPLFPLGYSTGIGPPDETEEEIAIWSAHGINFTRMWLSSRSPFSDPWSSWATHHAMPDNGYLPPSLRTSEERFEEGDFSWKIAAPAIPGVQTPAMFRGFWDGAAAVRPNTRYRVTARVKTRGVAGNGLLLKTGGWLGEAVTQSGIGTPLTVTARGDSPWFYLAGDYLTGPGETVLPNLYLVLEECTAGTAYCDRIVVQEVRTDGSLGGNILPKPSANAHLELDPARSLEFDHWARLASPAGIHAKAVILEKGDWLLNQFDAFGRIDPAHAVFAAPEGTKLRRLYEYYWRHLTARWGAETSIHSWELVNEGAPGSYADLTAALCDHLDTQGPWPRMASTSFWCCWDPQYWAGSPADYGDVHAYVMTTGWIDQVTIDGELYDRTALKEDPAAAVYAYSTVIGGDPLRTKPVILSETDLDMPGDQSPDPRLAADTLGMWLHDFNWAHLNAGGVPALIWNPDNIRRHGLYPQYRGLRAFVRGLALHEGDYLPAAAECSHPRLRAWGQKRADGTAAHLWVENRDHTWAKALASGPPAPISGTVTLTGLASGPMQLQTWSTNDTVPLATESIEVGADGRVAIPVDGLVWDLAYRLESGAGSVDEPTREPRAAFRLRVTPRPAHLPAAIRLDLPAAGRLRLEIFDVSGRRVRRLCDEPRAEGTHAFAWDGIADSGARAGAGVYFVRAAWGPEERTERLVLLR